MSHSRREFIQGLSLAMLAPALVREAFGHDTKKARLPIAFSTLGCPAWEWKKILDFASTHKFDAIELRGLEGNLDLPAHPVFAAERVEQTKREIQAAKLRDRVRQQFSKNVYKRSGEAG